MKEFKLFLERFAFNLKLLLTFKISTLLSIHKSLKLIEKKEYKQALHIINIWLMNYPKEIELLTLKGLCLKKLGREPQALEIYDYAYSLDNNDKSIAWEIWELMLLAWNNIKAIELLEETRDSKYKNSFYLYLLALWYIKTYQTKKAEDTIKEIEKYKLSSWDIENLDMLKKTLSDIKDKLKNTP